MGHLVEDLIMLVFMHFVSILLMAYITIKLFDVKVTPNKLIIVTFIYSFLTYVFRELIILSSFSVSIFIPINLALFVFMMILIFKTPWRCALLGILISFAWLIFGAPISSLVLKGMGWSFPSTDLIINLVAAYLEMMGIIVLAAVLKFNKLKAFKIKINSITSTGR